MNRALENVVAHLRLVGGHGGDLQRSQLGAVGFGEDGGGNDG